MDADVHDPPGQSTDQATERKGLRALFRKADGENGPVQGRSAENLEPAAASVTGTRPARRQQYVRALASRPVVNPRLRADPRLRVWVTRVIVTIAIFLGFRRGFAHTLVALARPEEAREIYQRGADIACEKCDLQTKREIEVFLRRLEKQASP